MWMTQKCDRYESVELQLLNETSTWHKNVAKINIKKTVKKENLV